MISKNPIAEPKKLHYEKILYKVIMFYPDGAPVEGKRTSEFYVDNQCYPAVEMLSIICPRPSENKIGMLVEGMYVDVNGNQLPGREIAKDIFIPFEHDGTPFRDGTWTDDLKLANQYNAQLVKELHEEVDGIIKEYTRYQAVLDQLVENSI